MLGLCSGVSLTLIDKGWSVLFCVLFSVRVCQDH